MICYFHDSSVTRKLPNRIQPVNPAGCVFVWFSSPLPLDSLGIVLTARQARAWEGQDHPWLLPPESVGAAAATREEPAPGRAAAA